MSSIHNSQIVEQCYGKKVAEASLSQEDTLGREDTQISITFEDLNKTLILTACPTCCDESWFDLRYGDLDQMVGKRLAGINMHKWDPTVESNDGDPQIEPSGIQEYDKYHKIVMSFEDETELVILLINSSNGYYDGYLSISIEDEMNDNVMY